MPSPVAPSGGAASEAGRVAGGDTGGDAADHAESKEGKEDAAVVIAGEGGEGYAASLHAQAVRLGIANDILWTGFLDGTNKLAAFAAASVFTCA